MKATHNGTCQVCGRVHAHRDAGPVAHGLAAHGYTVEQGWWSGVCGGTHAAPVELSTGLLDSVVVDLRSRAAVLLAIVPSDIFQVTVKWVGGWDSVKKECTKHTTTVSGADDVALLSLVRQPYGFAATTWENLQRIEVEKKHALAESMIEHAKMLVALKARRHGQPLFVREQEDDDKGHCPGSGRPPRGMRGRYGACACGALHPLTRRGVLRKHMPRT